MMLKYIGVDDTIGLKLGETYDVDVGTIGKAVRVMFWTGKCCVKLDYLTFKELFEDWQEVSL